VNLSLKQIDNTPMIRKLNTFRVQQHQISRTFFSYYSSSSSFSSSHSNWVNAIQKRDLSTTTTEELENTEHENENDQPHDEAATAEAEEEGPTEPSYAEKNPVQQGDTLYVRQRREFKQQLHRLRKDFVADPAVQDGNKVRRKRKKEIRRKRDTNKYRLQALLRPPPELTESLNEAKQQRKERSEMMLRIEQERKSLSAKYAAVRKEKVKEYNNEQREREMATMKAMVLSGAFLTQPDQIETWIEKKLSDTSMQNSPAFLSEDVWGTWSHVEDFEGEKFLGRDGKSPQEYFFGGR
jgi:hypothetical protein